MTRQLRQQSSTGIHHVMLRGINRQIMFETDDDYRKFIFILHDMVAPKDQFKRPLPPRCAIYAYCLMTNHVHLANYAKPRRDEILKAAKLYGASIRQLSRLTSIGYYIIQKA